MLSFKAASSGCYAITGAFYAGCYAKPFDKAKARHQNRLDSVARFV